MADVKEKKPAAPKQGGEGKGKGKDKGATGPVEHAPKVSEGTPRLLTHYMETVRPRLQREFDLKNPNQVPRLVKIVLNVGMGEAAKLSRRPLPVGVTPKCLEERRSCM